MIRNGRVLHRCIGSVEGMGAAVRTEDEDEHTSICFSKRLPFFWLHQTLDHAEGFTLYGNMTQVYIYWEILEWIAYF